MKKNMLALITLFSLNSFAEPNPQRFVVGSGTGHYNLWSIRPEFLESKIKSQADLNAIELCGGAAERRSDFTFIENFISSPSAKIEVIGFADYECL